MIEIIGFDADDTLWHNEKFFRLTQESFAELLKDHVDPANLDARLLAAEKRNLALYGFGAKGFVLSMIETAIEVSDETLPKSSIKQILDFGHEMLRTPVELLPHAREAVEAAAERYKTVVITKGDLFDQERKVAQSGLAEIFDGVEIVSDKSPDAYRRIFPNYGVDPSAAVMVGNSLKSDVVPMLDAGGWGVHVPHDLTWDLEHAEEPIGHARYRRIPDLGALIETLEALGGV